MYLIAYDISSDKIRTKIAKYLEKKGVRIQKSIFLINITAKKIDYVKRDLEELRKDDGVIHIFPLCKKCLSKAKIIGKPIPEDFLYFD